MRELLDLSLRWVHVIAGIMWIGNSLLFNWLDRSLDASGKEGIQGQVWLLHSGGFYFVEKDLRGWDQSRVLHWFKWQSYSTWLSGAALLVVVFYLGGASLLIDPAVRPLTPAAAAAISAGLLVGGWLVYDLLLAPLLARAGKLGALLGFLLVIGVGFALTRLFSSRAAFLHVGALLGTLMAGNVFRVIVPSQRQLVAGASRGEKPDAALAARAKSRSIHNNYITFPVIALMLSGHFPALYANPRSWLVLAVLLLAGAGVRHWLNLRFHYRGWQGALGATVVASLAALYLLTARGAAADRVPAAGPVGFAQANAVIQKRCAVCHSASPADQSFGVAPAGVAFDTPEQIRSRIERIRVRAVETRTMPLANRTHITDAERALLGAWIALGAP
jgi:uncharacterized membrane protein